MNPFAVELRSLRKEFPGCVANDGVSLQVRGGSIHGIVGENGAGKSTAMKMLYGLYPPDQGEILVGGAPRRWRSPKDAIRAGIGMVHQHFMLAEPETALDNLLLDGERKSLGARFLPRALRPVERRKALQELQSLSDRYRLPVDWESPIEKLPVGVQQRIEILKLLYHQAEILILDEPTAVLTPQETQIFFDQLRGLRAEGKTILIITHKLKEVMALTDRVSVFRAGRVVGETDTAATSPEALADWMVGRKVSLTVAAPPAPVLGNAVLSLERLCVRDRLQDLSFEVRSGEIVGIAGVEGNGQSELIQAILSPADRQRRTSGGVRVLGQEVSDWETARIKDLGVGLIPEDRHRDGLLLNQSMQDNFLLGKQRSSEFQKAGWLRPSKIREAAAQSFEEYDVRPRGLSLLAKGLSGGNQQKAIIARELRSDPGLILAAQPTRGVDVGAIEFIHGQLFKARARGAGVLLISSELDEILALSDRILVLYRGRLSGEFSRGQASARELGLRMGGSSG